MLSWNIVTSFEIYYFSTKQNICLFSSFVFDYWYELLNIKFPRTIEFLYFIESISSTQKEIEAKLDLR